MDLGTILAGVASVAQTYQSIRRPVMTTPIGMFSGGIPGPLDMPGIETIGQPPACDTKDYYWSTRANHGQGGWVKYRRRRKQLATQSDLRDLASLKSILGPSDLKTWIATHS